MWFKVYRLRVGFGVAKGEAWRSGWWFRCEVYEKNLFDRILRRFLSLPKVKGTVLMRLCDIAVLTWSTEKPAYRMILKTGRYETKDLSSTMPFRYNCRNALRTLARLQDPLNIVKSHRNPFETGVRKCSDGASLNLVTKFPSRSLQILKTFADKRSVPFRKSENLTES
jgi:hypothetical protein